MRCIMKLNSSSYFSFRLLVLVLDISIWERTLHVWRLLLIILMLNMKLAILRELGV